MNDVTGEHLRTTRSRGRKDSSGQEANVDLTKLKSGVSHLVALHMQCKDARTEYSEAVKALAESCGVNAASIRRFVNARAGKNYSDHRRNSQQLEMMFDEVGES
jgi:hypothetical protein